MFKRIPIAVAVATTLLTLASTGWCTETAVATTTTDDGYGYRFKDDLVGASGIDSSAPQLHVVRHMARDLLIRPRTAFIPELLKSVENL
jgi:hypothetical protein